MRLVLACSAAILLMLAPSAACAGMKVGKPAPNFELTLVDGSKVKLSDMRGQVVLVNFWATWCVPCKAELPLLDSYYRRAQKYGLRMFAVTTEDSVPIYRLKPLFAVMAIPAGKRVRGGALDEVEAVPTNYIIDRAGVVRYAKAGAFDLDGLNAAIIPLLNEHPPEGTVGTH